MKYLFLILSLLSFNASALIIESYVGWPSSVLGSQDRFKYQCPTNALSAVLDMAVTDLQPVDEAEVNASMSKPGGMISSVLRFKLPYTGTNGVYGQKTHINYPYKNNQNQSWNQIQVQRVGYATYFDTLDGLFYVKLRVQCMTGLHGTGSAAGVPRWEQTDNSGQY